MSTMDDIKDLRAQTGVSIMQCKRALEEAEGDMDKAKVILRKISSSVAEKKSDRELSAGAAQAYVHANNKIIGVAVVACETDFVAKNDEFISLTYDIAMHVAAMAPEFLSRSHVQEGDIAAAQEVFEKESADKPEEMRSKIVDGKIDSYLKDKVLLEQPFVKNGDVTIGQLIEEATQKFGEKIEVSTFARYSV